MSSVRGNTSFMYYTRLALLVRHKRAPNIYRLSFYCCGGTSNHTRDSMEKLLTYSCFYKSLGPYDCVDVVVCYYSRMCCIWF